MKPGRDIDRLIAIMAALRTPGSGCPWDLAQSFETIAPYTIEEAYEVADAIARGDFDDLRDELGDVLLQVVFHSRMAEEAGHFAFADVVEAITAKLVRRHPHVFGDAGRLDQAAVNRLWDQIKAEEKAERAKRGALPAQGILSDVPVALPALTRALKLQSKAATVGFDWDTAEPIVAKIEEELGEVSEAAREAPETVAEEVGDLLFAVANLARHYRVDPEAALRAANAKFTRRFESIERALAAAGKTPAQSSLKEMDALWDAAKRAEREGS